MKLLAALACAALFAGAQDAQQRTLYSSDMPPARFRGDSAAIVLFVSDVGEFCPAAGREGMVTVACKFDDPDTGAPVVVLPNPCPAADYNRYALIVCHELGHVNGWTRWHEE